MPLEVGNLRAGQEDVLTGPGGGLLLLDLEFHDLGRVLDDLGDVGPVAGSDFTKDTLINPDNTTNKPVALEFYALAKQNIENKLGAYPEDTDLVKGAIRWPVRLDHTEHAVKLPADEKDDEEVVRVPEPLKVCATPLLEGKEDHGKQAGGHDPPSSTWTSGKVRCQESNDTLTGGGRRCISHGQLVEVDHVGNDVDDCADNDGPGGCLVESDVLVKGDDVVQRCSAEEGDEVTADGKQDEDHIYVHDKSGSTGNGWRIIYQLTLDIFPIRIGGRTIGNAKSCTSTDEIVLQLVVEETEQGDQEMEDNPDSEEHSPATLIDHPDVEFLAEGPRRFRLAVSARVCS